MVWRQSVCPLFIQRVTVKQLALPKSLVLPFEMIEDFPSVSPPSHNVALNEPDSPRSSSVALHQPRGGSAPLPQGLADIKREGGL